MPQNASNKTITRRGLHHPHRGKHSFTTKDTAITARPFSRGKCQISDSRRRGTWYCAPPSVTLLPFVSTPGRDNHKHRISLMNHTEQSLPFSLGCQAVEIRDVVHRMPVDALDNIAS